MNTPEKIYSVTEINTIIDNSLSEHRVIVQGEVSNFKIDRNKFVYFDLKDENSILGCFIMRFHLKTPMEDGMEIKIYGRIGVYIPKGRLTFRVESIQPVGEGALRRAMEMTRKKLEAEGIFKPEYKKPIPRFPQTIGIITAEGAAAYTDVLRILQNRWSGLEIFLKPALVQGMDAVSDIISSLAYFNSRHPVDVIILTRGGGSLEDLSAFNNEDMCRAVFASKIPIIAGIGHERDETLVEFVADMRASTPTNAAELVVPDKREWREKLDEMQITMIKNLELRASSLMDKIQNMTLNLNNIFTNNIDVQRNNLYNAIRLLKSFSPQQKINAMQEKIYFFKTQYKKLFHAIFSQKKESILQITRILNSLNPTLPLHRGYSLSYVNGKLLRKIEHSRVKDILETHLADGIITSKITSKK